MDSVGNRLYFPPQGDFNRVFSECYWDPRYRMVYMASVDIPLGRYQGGFRSSLKQTYLISSSRRGYLNFLPKPPRPFRSKISVAFKANASAILFGRGEFYKLLNFRTSNLKMASRVIRRSPFNSLTTDDPHSGVI